MYFIFVAFFSKENFGIRRLNERFFFLGGVIAVIGSFFLIFFVFFV